MGSGVWLTIIGVGEDGLEGLSNEALTHVKAARHVFGGTRHLALVADAIQGQSHAWPSPLIDVLPELLACAGTPTVVVATGDPLHYGIATWLLSHIDRQAVRILPHSSSIALACARLGWAQQNTQVISLHGRDESRLNAHLHNGASLLILTSDAAAPGRLASALCANGFARSHAVLLEALGGPHERVRHLSLDAIRQLAFKDIHPLNLLALTLCADPAEGGMSLSAGRPSDQFLHDGQITRPEIRALTLARLAPQFGERLWDIGAGSGAVSIEWLRMHPSLTAVAVEQHPKRCERVRENARRFGVPHLQLIEGQVPDMCDALADHGLPDAIFMGGGVTLERVMWCATHLNPGGRLVINAVTLETEQCVLEAYQRMGGTLTRIGLEHAGPLGPMTGWQAARTITQWCWIKSREPSE